MVLVMLCLVMSVTAPAKAATQAQAVQWCKDRVDSTVEYYHVNNYQCTDFVAKYADEVFGYVDFGKGRNAKDLISYQPGGGWRLIPGNGDIQPGDVFISTNSGPYGHTGVIVAPVSGSTVYVIDQNYGDTTKNIEFGLNKPDYPYEGVGQPPDGSGLRTLRINVHKYTVSNIAGVLRPPLTPDTPKPGDDGTTNWDFIEPVRHQRTVPDGYVGIYTAQDLDNMRNNLTGKYVLMNDIDLADWGNWEPIGDGNNYLPIV